MLLLLPSPLYSPAHAQTAATGAVAGRVTDRGGAAVVGAEIELQSAATGQTQRQLTNRAGQFSFSRVAPGAYHVAAQMRGFRRALVAGVRVEVAKAYDLEMRLEVGDLVETVTVEAGAGVELQKRDSTVGSVVPEESLLRLPSLERSAVEFLTLQPGAIPEAGDGDNGTSGGAVAGARSDQNTFTVDGIDITENSTGGGSAFRTMIPAPVESVEEFRVGVTNPNASFARASGAQVALIGRRGTREFHGAGYWYHQNDALNANTWTNNRTGVPIAPQKDHRYGLRVGGPLFAGERTFFFANYERRDFSRSLEVSRVVPTATLRQGVVRFRDNAGRVVSYDLAASTLCSPTANRRCDPRGLGLSPAVNALWSLLPAGNDPSVGDGLNTTGWRSTAHAPLTSDYFVARFDHELAPGWRLDASATYFRRLSVLGGATSLRQQLDIRAGAPVFPGQIPQRGQNVTLGLTGLVTPAFTSSFKFGWSRDRQSSQPLSPAAVADLLAIPGTQAASGRVALNIGGGQLDQLLSEPIDVDSQRARAQANDNEPFQFVYDGTWLGRRGHTFQFGANVRHVITRHARTDRSGGALTSPVADIFRGSNIQIPNTSRPPTCAATGQLNCLQAGEVQQWDTLFAAVTGMIDAVNLLAVRDADLAALPLGAPLSAESRHDTYDFYFQDHWQPAPSLVVNLGLTYGWQPAPVEKFGRQTLMINNETAEPLTLGNYIEPRRRAALNGDIYNPQLAFLTLKASGRDTIFDTDRDNLAPRLSAAWNPSFETGALGLLFGPRRTVVRGGFALVYDRVNTSESVIIPTLGVGFGQAVSRRAPLCNATGAGGANCTPAGTAPASAFRVGVDGLIPLPAVPGITTPIIPAQPFGETASFQIDPEFKVGKSYSFDLTVQRELPGATIFEVGWIGRMGRELPANVNFNSSPIFHRDTASGQTFAQAFDAVAQLLRAGVPAASVPAQGWFQNNIPGGTARVLTGNESNFIAGNVSNVFQTVDTVRLAAGLRPFNNLQTQTSFVRTSTGRSNYHALAAALRKRLARSLAFDLNYTFSKSLDTSSTLQQVMSVGSSAFFPDFDYGPSDFDRTHVFNAHFLWELPAGRGRHFDTSGALDHVVGGWSLSGILRAATGLPVVVTQGAGALGGGSQQAAPVAAVPLVDPSGLGTGVHPGVAGANNVGTNGDPSTGGSGINLFRDPAQALASFRRVLVSQDGRSGRANPLRGLGGWNLDLSLGKSVSLGERARARVSLDFFNVFNHTVFTTPALDLSNPRAFGVVTQQTVPTRREAASRWIQIGARVEF